jgi:hypothetical protein
MIGAELRSANQLKDVMGAEATALPSLGNISNLYKTLAVAAYGALIAGSVIFQGLNALYYFTRARILRGYLEQTPPWVVELLRHQAGGR